MTIDVVDRSSKRFGVEEGILDIFGVAFEPFVGTEPSARGTPELSADLLLLASDMFGCPPHQVVVGIMTRYRRHVGQALGGPQYLELALGNAVAGAIHPGQCVMSLCGAHVD